MVEDQGDLVDVAAVRRRPGAPLRAIDRAQLALRVGPVVPDADAVALQVGDVGVALEEPQQFVDDRFQVQLLGGQQREALGQVEAHLVADRKSTRLNLQSLMRISYAVFCLKKKTTTLK